LDYQYYMSMALDQAKKAFQKGEFPVGCVIVEAGEVIASGARTGTTSTLPVFSETDHAEIRALKELEKLDKQFVPEQLTLFSTMEPCLMCFGAIILSGIKTVVYSFEDPMGGGTACDLNKLPLLYSKADINVVSGVLRQKSLDLFYNFFNKETNLYWKNSYLEAYTLEQKKKNGVEDK
jgi:tRNA(adenine34) deaminase